MSPRTPPNPLKVGDRVLHIDGGPEMKITSIEGRIAWCAWSVGPKKITRVFPAEELRIAPIHDSKRHDCQDFSVGKIVKHRSGGPSMTVTELSGGWAWCEWTAHGHAQSRLFPCAELFALAELDDQEDGN